MEDQGRLDEHLRSEYAAERDRCGKLADALRPNMQDSGERQQFASGAVRDAAAGKPRPDLISPHAHMREGTWLGIGAVKYAERNWEAGIPISRCLASAIRHTIAFQLGLTDEDHAAAARTNWGFIIHYQEEIAAGRMDPAIDDMPKYTQREAFDAMARIVKQAEKTPADDLEINWSNPYPDENGRIRFFYKGKPFIGQPASRVTGTVTWEPTTGKAIE